MAFNRILLPRTELEADTDPVTGHRVYLTPHGPMESVTTVLAKALDSSKIDDWKDRVGEDEVSQVLSQARNRGNAVHKLCEAYLLQTKVPRSEIMPGNKSTFLEIKRFLDRFITNIYGVELPLFSNTLHTAGRADIVATWYGRNSIIDFKTSRRAIKKSNDDRILKYNLQATAYAMMAEEMYGVMFPQNVIIATAAHEPPHIIVKRNDKYRPIVERMFEYQWNQMKIEAA